MASAEKMSIEEIEAGLARLMPRGLTEEARLELEETVEELAEGVDLGADVSLWQRHGFWQAAAALMIAAMGLGFFWKNEDSGSSDLAFLETGVDPDRLEVLGQRTWIESGSGLGDHTIGEDVSQGWSYSGIEEERLLHKDSGDEVILQRGFEAVLYAASSL